MKIKVSGATPTQINYLVAHLHGWVDDNNPAEHTDPEEALCASNWWLKHPHHEHYKFLAELDYCGDWAQGGPIIEREFMDVEVTPCGPDQGAPYDTWRAWKHNDDADATVMCGPTPLIAAMRCYAVSRLGDEVEVPDELS